MFGLEPGSIKNYVVFSGYNAIPGKDNRFYIFVNQLGCSFTPGFIFTILSCNPDPTNVQKFYHFPQTDFTTN